MFNTKIMVQLLCFGVIVLGVALSGVTATQLSAEAGRSQLVYTDRAEEGDPPEVVLGIALGAFRGPLVSYLWYRANDLKEDGKFHEAMELSSMITRLQPRFPRVWAFHAWNMAYNISVATDTAEERWRWVNAGIQLLRDEGIPANPNDILLHRELAWILFHKIGGYTDDANRYYKKQFAEEWTEILGVPPAVSQENFDDAKATRVEWFRPVAEAPTSFRQLVEDDLEAIRAELRDGERDTATSAVEELANLLSEESGNKLDRVLLRRIIEIQEGERRGLIGREPIEPGDPRLEGLSSDQLAYLSLRDLLFDPRFENAWPKLLAFTRRQILVNDYNMDPNLMLRYMEELGPLDWRHSSSHAIYWARKGVEAGLSRQSLSNMRTVNTDRQQLHAIQQLYRDGTIYYDFLTGEYFGAYDLNFADIYSELVEELIDRNDTVEGRQRFFTLFGAGHENFLKDAIRVNYRMGYYRSAERYYNRLVSWDGLNSNAAQRTLDEFGSSLKEFVEKQLVDRIQTPHVAASEFYAAMQDAFIRGLLAGNMQIFQQQFTWAHKAHTAFWDYQDVEQNVDPDRRRMELLPADFITATGVAFRQLVGQRGLEPAQASVIYANLPVDVQLVTYDFAINHYTNLHGYSREVLEAAFREPPGIEQHRAMMEQREEQLRGDRRDIEAEQQ